MKHLSKITWIIVIAMASCTKEQSSTTLGNVDQNQLDYTLDQIPLVQNPQSEAPPLSMTSDKDDEKILKFRHEIAWATRELIKDIGFNQTIIQLAKDNVIDVVYLLDLKTEAPIYYQMINERLAQKNLSLEYIAENMTHSPVIPHPSYAQTAQIEHYEPAIFIPNLNNIVHSNKQPLLSAGTFINGDKNPEFEDFTVMWYFSASGDLNEIILSEKTSRITSNPIFIIDNAERFDKDAIVLGENDETQPPMENTSVSDRVINRFDSRELKIQTGYRYEASGASEYAIQGYRIESNGTIHWVYDPSGWKEITEIQNSQIGQTVIVPSLHAYNWTPYANNKFFWNTYERDWTSSEKNLGSATFGGQTIYLSGRRQYTSEWYAWVPETLQDHATPFEWYGWETSVNFASWKADYVVHKIE